MRIGINGSSLIALGSSATDIVEHAVKAEADGFSTYWLAQLAVPDALTLHAVIGGATSSIELGTAVIPTWLRHPLMLAGQALTTQELTGGRLAVGIGLAHKDTIEQRLKIPFERPAHHMDEYLSVLLPAMQDRAVSFEGEIWSGVVEGVGGPGDVSAPAVLLAAMGPRMLALAGARTDGSILWLSGPTTIAQRIRPALEEAAQSAGRGEPRIVASVPLCVTDDPAQVRQQIARSLGSYNYLPSYRSVMDQEGVGGPEDVSIVGDEDHVRAELARFAEAGTTDFSALEFTLDPEAEARTRSLLRDVAGVGR